MSGMWLASYVLLWIVVGSLSVAVLGLIRLVGSINERLGPVGAAMLDAGPEIGDSVTDILEREEVEKVAGVQGTGTDRLMVFISPGCSSCIELIPGLIPFSKRVRDRVEVVVLNTDAGQPADGGVWRRLAEVGMPVTNAPVLARALGVDATPYGVWIDREDRVRTKGVVNHAQHLESLLLAQDVGVASMQEMATRAIDRPNPEP